MNMAQDVDPYLWLENIDAEKSMEWVKQQNEKTLTVLTVQPDCQTIYEKNLEIYNSDDRIPDPTIYGDYIYNFWQEFSMVR